MEFQPVGEAAEWRVEKADLLVTEFGLADGTSSRPMAAAAPPVDLVKLRGQVAAFVFFCQTHPRLWLLTRRIYGIAPLIPAADAVPADMRVWTRAEMEAEGYAVATDLEALRGLWLDHERREVGRGQEAGGQRSEVGGQNESAALSRDAATELELDDRVLEQFNFSERLFRITVYDPLANNGKGGVVPRSEKENQTEREWFIERVQAWAKMLRDSIGGPVARAALMNEMTMRRLESEIAVADPKSRAALYEQKADEVSQYKSSVEELQRMFPELAVAGKVSFHGTVSDLIAAHLDYYGNGDRRLVDKVYTVLEMEYLVRASAQVEARYRFSLNLAIIDAINGLTDPNFRPRFKPRVLKLIDAGFRSGLEAARATLREKVVDLEAGVLPGEGDDFEDFNDAECPHCGGRISSQASRCPECRKTIKTTGPQD